MKLALFNLVVLSLALFVVHGNPAKVHVREATDEPTNELETTAATLASVASTDDDQEQQTDEPEPVATEDSLQTPPTTVGSSNDDDDEKRDVDAIVQLIKRGKKKSKGRRNKNLILKVVDNNKDGKGYGRVYGSSPYFCTNKNNQVCKADPDNKSIGAFGISGDQKAVIMAKHNECRANMTAIFGATSIPEMKWQDWLAAPAQKYAQLCPTGHDKSVNREVGDKHISVGQNMCFGHKDWAACITAWCDEWHSFRVDAQNNVHAVGHLTQMINYKTSIVGCGYAQCNGMALPATYICNYAVQQTQHVVDHPMPFGERCTFCEGSCEEETGLCDCGDAATCENQGQAMMADTCNCGCHGMYVGSANCTVISTDWQTKNCGAGKDSWFCNDAGYSDKCGNYQMWDWCPNKCREFTKCPE